MGAGVAPTSLAVLENILYFVSPESIWSLNVTESIATELTLGTVIDGAQIRSDDTALYVAANTSIYRYAPADLQELVGALFEAESIAVTNEHVFFTTGNDGPAGSVWEMKKDGSDLKEIARSIPHLNEIAADDGDVWVVSRGDDESGSPRRETGRILHIP